METGQKNIGIKVLGNHGKSFGKTHQRAALLRSVRVAQNPKWNMELLIVRLCAGVYVCKSVCKSVCKGKCTGI